jgi:hypothetical protein
MGRRIVMRTASEVDDQKVRLAAALDIPTSETNTINAELEAADRDLDTFQTEKEDPS